MDTEEESAIQELKSMSRAELDLVPYETVKWVCQAKGCCNGTKVRDYGIAPEYWSQRLKEPFFDVSLYFWMCSKHLKMWKHLIKMYSENHVYNKLMDYDKQRIIKLKSIPQNRNN